MKIATWNINSVRLRIELVKKVLSELQPDVLCLQETKCPPGQFPVNHLHELGYNHIAEFGQKSYNGVAIISRYPIYQIDNRSMCGRSDCRHISVQLGKKNPVTIHNFYVPAGGDEPDPIANDKFAHKLQFLDELEKWSSDEIINQKKTILVGDLNIAPCEHDVWSHKDLLKIVSHTPLETEKLLKILQAGQWVDVMRQYTPEPEKLYTWWSYRAKDWEVSNRGRRLDHIWTSADLATHCTHIDILKQARGWQQPSDHVPVMATFNLEIEE